MEVKKYSLKSKDSWTEPNWIKTKIECEKEEMAENLQIKNLTQIKLLIFLSLLLYPKETGQLAKPNDVQSPITQKNSTESVKLSDKTMDSEKRLGKYKFEKAVRSAAENEGEDENEDEHPKQGRSSWRVLGSFSKVFINKLIAHDRYQNYEHEQNF